MLQANSYTTWPNKQLYNLAQNTVLPFYENDSNILRINNFEYFFYDVHKLEKEFPCYPLAYLETKSSDLKYPGYYNRFNAHAPPGAF